MLNTFFFGYLSHKWRRLVRTLIIIGFAYFTFGNYKTHFNFYESYFDYEYFLMLTFLFILAIALISWVLKPFIVKE